MLNIFEFDGMLFIQRIGTAMGTNAAPTFANLFMGKIDKMIQKAEWIGTRNLIMFYKRFIDDILLIWCGTEAELLQFLDMINSLHPTIKFTWEYNLNKRSTNFLDTKVYIVNNRIESDLYRKKCDRVQYVGESERSCVTRCGEHLYYIKSNKEATGSHFNSKGHTHENMEIQIIEKVYPNSKDFRLERESYWINKLRTKNANGLNKNTN